MILVTFMFVIDFYLTLFLNLLVQSLFISFLRTKLTYIHSHLICSMFSTWCRTRSHNNIIFKIKFIYANLILIIINWERFFIYFCLDHVILSPWAGLLTFWTCMWSSGTTATLIPPLINRHVAMSCDLVGVICGPYKWFTLDNHIWKQMDFRKLIWNLKAHCTFFNGVHIREWTTSGQLFISGPIKFEWCR